MKPRRILSVARLSFPLASALAVLFSTPALHAAALTWDAGNTANGTTIDPLSGNWNTTAGNIVWNNAGTNVIWDQTSTTVATNSAIFGGTDGTVDQYVVTLASQMATSSLTFNNSGYKLTGSTIYNTSGNITVAAGKTATISSILAGTAGLTKLDSGALTLNGSAVNTFTGGLNVNLGTLTLNYTNLATPTNLIAATNALQINNGTLTITGKATATTVQTFASTSLGGMNTVNISRNGASGSATLNLGALTVASGPSTIFTPTTAWTTTASTTERVFISAGGSVPSLPGAGITAFVNAGVFYRPTAGAAGSLRLAAVNSSGQLLQKANAGSVSATMGVDPTGSYQYGDALSHQLTNTGASIYGLLLNAQSAGVVLTVANSGTLTLNSVIQIKATESVSINAGTGVSNIVIGSEKNLVLAMDNTAGLTINAPIANNGSSGGVGGTASALTIVGNTSITPGTVTLGGANTYSGATTITRGTLSLANVNALQNTSGITMANGTTLRSTVINTVVNAPIGITTAATIQNNTTGSGTSTRNLTLGGAISGTGNVTFRADGGTNSYALTILNAASSYIGTTTITTGVGNQMSLVRLGIDNALPVTTELTLAGTSTTAGRYTQLDLRGFSQEIAGLTGTMGANRTLQIINSLSATPTGTLTINTPVSTSFTFSGKIGDAGTPGTLSGANFNLEKKGLGTQILSGTNELTGTTTVLGGILSLGNANALTNSAFNTAGSIIGDGNNGLRTTVTTLTLGGLTGGNDFSTRFTSTTGGYTGLTGLTLNPGTGVTNSYSADIGNGNGSMTLTKTGLGTQVLTGTNTYTGATTITAGTLSINTIKDVSGGSSAIGAPTTVATGLITMGNAATTGTLLYTGAVQSTDRTIQIGTNSTTPAVGDTGGATLQADGASDAALTFSAATFNTQTDATTGVGANRTLTLQGASTGANTISGIIQDNLVSGAGTGTATVALTKAGAGTWVLGGTAANTYTGLTTVTAGELDLNKTAAVDAIAGNVTINGGTLKLLASNQIKDTSAITMSSGAFSLNGQSETVTSFSNSGGTFTTGAGTLIGTGATVTWSGGTNTINDGGSVQDGHLVISGGTNTVEGGATGGILQLNTGGAGLEMSNGATLTLNSDNTTAGKLLLKGDVSTSGNSTVTIASGLANTNAGNIDLDTGTRIFTVADGTAATDLSVSAVITNGALTKAGAGTMTLSGASTYTGNTTISGGTLQLGAGSTTGSLSTSSAIVNNGNLTIDRSNAVTQGTDFSGADITGTGSFTQAGTGTTSLNVANSYSGGTTVSAGTLALSHNSAAGTAGISITGASAATLQIDVGITLAGNNITFSNTNAASSVKHDVAASGTYSTGTSGTLTTSFAGGQADTTAQILGGTSSVAATLEMLFAGTSAATNDAIRRSDVFTTNGTSTDTYVIQLSTGALAADSVLAWLNGSNQWVHAGTTFYNETYSFAARVVGDYGYDSGNVWAVVDHGGSFAAVPEPTSALAGLLVGAGLLRRRRSA